MAFTRELNVTKIGIEDFQITFFVPGPGNSEDVQSGELEFQIALSNGQTEIGQVNLLARLGDDAEGQGYLQDLANLRDYIRTRLNNEVLPL